MQRSPMDNDLVWKHWQKVTTYIEIIFHLKDKAGDILYFICCQQLRPKPTMCQSVLQYSLTSQPYL